MTIIIVETTLATARIRGMLPGAYSIINCEGCGVELYLSGVSERFFENTGTKDQHFYCTQCGEPETTE